MQLAFSTLGCPAWTLDEIIDAAQRFGYAGLEFRGLLDQIDLQHVLDFMPTRIADTHARLRESGLHVACLSTSIAIVSAGRHEVDRHQAIATAKVYIEMAKSLGAPFVRFFGGAASPEMSPNAARDAAVASLREIGDFALQRGVTAVVETHDDLVESRKLEALIRATNHPSIGVLWDIHHPYRLAGEEITQTMQHLGDLIRYTHIKDSVLNEDGEHFSYVPLGHGDVPIQEAIQALKSRGYDGFLTLEWEKRWIPALDPPEVALPQYVEQMQCWLADL